MNLFVFLFACLVSTISYGMSPDGTHTLADYEDLSFEIDEFDASCAVVDSQAGITMTGVLVAPDIVVTAAHGIEAIFKKLSPTQTNHGIAVIPISSIRVYFKGKNQTIVGEVSRVLLDPRYFQDANAREGKFDFAFLKLIRPIRHITPAALFQKETIPSNALMTVVTYGMSDVKHTLFNWGGSPLLRRAFRLYERDTYFGRHDDDEVLKSSRYLQESSVYFKPLKRNIQPEETDAEEIVRSFEATQNWVADGKKPYALGLPGTSGSPVFIRLNENGKTKDYLFGLVSSYAHLTGQFRTKGTHEMEYILTHQQQSLGGYQTIFSLFYRNKTDEPAQKSMATYTQDPIFKFLLKAVIENHDGEMTEEKNMQTREEISTQKDVGKTFISKLLNIF